MASPILLILGAGSNLGQQVAKAFIAKGYKAALVSRRADESKSSADQVYISADLSNSDSVVNAFSKVKSQLGLPSVVIYNAAMNHKTDAKDPLSIPVADLSNGLAINTISPYVAAQQAVKAFEELPASASKTFIYTGNFLNYNPMPALLDLGLGKTATAHIIQIAAQAYADRGYKFYFADEREEDGTPMWGGVTGDAAAEHYPQLAEQKEQGPWLQTFVHGKGYKAFPVKI